MTTRTVLPLTSGRVIQRSPASPIIVADMDARMGDNINGPSLLRVPDWVERPLGRYYLYFSHHEGQYLRLAYADVVEGPWTVYEPGVIPVAQSGFATPEPGALIGALDALPKDGDWAQAHVASPDVHVDHEARQIRIYYHGLLRADTHGQGTRVALSTDGLHFEPQPDVLGPAYFRVFRWQGWWYAWSMPGVFSRSRDGLTTFDADPSIPHGGDWHQADAAQYAARTAAVRSHLRFPINARHAAVHLDEENGALTVVFSLVGDDPEHLVATAIDLRRDWAEWEPGPIVDLLFPEGVAEGADLTGEPSRYGAVLGRRAHQLRDPCVFTDDDGTTWLLYSIAGEAGIGLASLR